MGKISTVGVVGTTAGKRVEVYLGGHGFPAQHLHCCFSKRPFAGPRGAMDVDHALFASMPGQSIAFCFLKEVHPLGAAGVAAQNRQGCRTDIAAGDEDEGQAVQRLRQRPDQTEKTQPAPHPYQQIPEAQTASAAGGLLLARG